MTTTPNPVQRVLINGGTHGNEYTGVALIQKSEQHPDLVQRNSFETFVLLANPEAFAANRRYIDQDLNRSFHQKDLQNLTLNNHELNRAREINKLYGENGTMTVDVLIDLHTTTSNMGLTLITDEHPFNLELVAYLQNVNPSVNIYIIPKTATSSSLPTICSRGCTIEVGPIAQGTLNAEIFGKTEELVHSILDYLEQYNQGEIFSFVNKKLTVYRHSGKIDYPRNESGEIIAMVHSRLKDYKPLNPGDPVFVTFDGQTITYEGQRTVILFLLMRRHIMRRELLCVSPTE